MASWSHFRGRYNYNAICLRLKYLPYPVQTGPVFYYFRSRTVCDVAMWKESCISDTNRDIIVAKAAFNLCVLRFIEIKLCSLLAESAFMTDVPMSCFERYVHPMCFVLFWLLILIIPSITIWPLSITIKTMGEMVHNELMIFFIISNSVISWSHWHVRSTIN